MSRDEKIQALGTPTKRFTTPNSPGPAVRADEGEPSAAPPSTPAGRRYAGDHRNHGESNVDNEALVEDINLDELPDSEGPDA